jgi:MFS transporter, NNP family, nitrate/nitrite transporter
MNDIASTRASFAEQAVIFQRRHNWIMCWLYTGTFGSFIGYSAGFPLLAKTQFPEVNALAFAFLGPLVGNASTFQMIPAIMRKETERMMPRADAMTRIRQADKESAAIIGFSSAVAAYGAFFIPKSYGTSISMTGGAEAALLAFLVFYLSCIAVTWWFYTRRGGLLHDLERHDRSPASVNLQPNLPR